MSLSWEDPEKVEKEIKHLSWALAIVLVLGVLLALSAHAQDFSHVKENGVESLQPNFPFRAVTSCFQNGIAIVGSFCYPTITSCINAASPSTFQACWMPPGNYTHSADLTVPDHVGLWMSCGAVVSASGAIKIPSTSLAFFVKGVGSGSTVTHPCVEWNSAAGYNGDLLDIGDGGAGTLENYFEGVTFQCLSTAGANCTPAHVNNAAQGWFINFHADNTSTQTGPALIIEGNLSFSNTFISGGSTSIKILNGAHATKFFGHRISNPVSGIPSLDMQSSRNTFDGQIDGIGSSTGVNLSNSSSTFGNIITVDNNSLTTDGVIGAAAHDNTVNLLNPPGVITDNSTLAQNNVVIVQGRKNGGNTVLNAQSATGTLTGNATDQTIFTFTIPANAVGPGRGFRLRFNYAHTVGTASVTYKVILGATTIHTWSSTDSTTQATGLVDRYNAAGVQNSQFGSAFVFGNVLLTGGTGSPSSENLAAASSVKLTFNVANTDQVVGGFWSVELIQ